MGEDVRDMDIIFINIHGLRAVFAEARGIAVGVAIGNNGEYRFRKSNSRTPSTNGNDIYGGDESGTFADVVEVFETLSWQPGGGTNYGGVSATR